MKKYVRLINVMFAISVAAEMFGSMPVFGSNTLMRLSGESPQSSMPPPGMTNPDWENDGRMSVVACGRDANGVWQTVPLCVEYHYNGFQYMVKVLSAWNPWTREWAYNLNLPAVNTYFTDCGTEYDFYVVLSTGTYYFNL